MTSDKVVRESAPKDPKDVEGRVLRSYAPATGELVGEVPVTPIAEVSQVMARARTAQVAWGASSVESRAREVLRFRDAIVEAADEVVDLLSRETGKPRFEALAHEVLVVADFATYFAKRAPVMLAPHEIEQHLLRYKASYVHYAPRGVVAIISPWNYPFMIPMTDVFCALFAGNAVVVKPSEITPLVVQKAKEIFDTTGLDKDLFQVVHGEGPVGAALVEAKPDKVVFTGAVSTGRRVAAACGERLIPCTMELGGKAPAIVCADADVERTAASIVHGGFANSGQICISVERVLAHASVHDALVERIVERTKALRQGDPAEGIVDVGAIIFPKQATIVEKLVADAAEKGATIRTGGKRREGKGLFFEPTVLTGCTLDMAVMREEIFGPLLPIMKVTDEEEAVRIANDSPLGLAAYVFTRDAEHGKRLAERVRAGMVQVNDTLTAYASAGAPFGGVKDSGFGRVHGEEGLREMCEVRYVNYERFPMRSLFGFPYDERRYGAMAKGLRLLYGKRSAIKRVLELF